MNLTPFLINFYPMIKVVFEPLAIEQILRWTKEDLKPIKKIFQLINNMAVTPYEGLGKP